jgi:uncharacterized protein
MATTALPIVDYLIFDESKPYLRAQACRSCGAEFLTRHNSCSRCGNRTFREVRLPRTGVLESFTIIHRAPPGIPTPYVSAVARFGESVYVKARLVDVDPSPERVHVQMKVSLTTFSAATDSQGTEAIAFAFKPSADETDEMEQAP